jgi:hypothetical protein
MKRLRPGPRNVDRSMLPTLSPASPEKGPPFQGPFTMGAAGIEPATSRSVNGERVGTVGNY